MSSTNPSYLIEGGKPGRERLLILSQAMRPLSESFLDRLGIRPGMRCLDAGCGGGDVTRLIATRCGPNGRTVGIDTDPVVIDLARADNLMEEEAGGVSDRAPIEFHVADVNTFKSDTLFDLVYGRFILSHLTDAEATLTHLCSLLREGGILAIEDVWFPGHFCSPGNAAFSRYVGWYREAAQMRGANPDIGKALPSLFSQQDLADVRFEMHSQAFGSGSSKHVSLLTLERIRKRIVESGIASDYDVLTVIEALRAFTAREESIVSMAPVMQIHGVKTTPSAGTPH